jgi:hypothetical protein
MIKFALNCRDGHEFEGWFRSGEAYEAQAATSQITCPHCGCHEVTKAIMAPAVAIRSRAARAAKSQPAPDIPMQQLQNGLRRIRDEVRARAEYVGDRFAEEARRIHFDESPARGIYGEATSDEARSLAEDGIPFLPVPRLPEDMT